MSYKNVQIEIYNNIVDAKDKLQAWSGSAGVLPECKDLATLFISFPGVFSSMPDAAMKRWGLFVNKLPDTLAAPTYLLLMEPGKEPGNKIRTNKGWLPGKIKTAATCLELEMPLANGYTQFVAVIKLLERNKEMLLAEYAGGSNACMIVDHKSQGAEIFSNAFLVDFAGKYADEGKADWLQLAAELHLQEKTLYCFGGEAGQPLCCVFFCHQRLKDRVLEQAEQALERNYTIEEM